MKYQQMIETVNRRLKLHGHGYQITEQATPHSNTVTLWLHNGDPAAQAWVESLQFLRPLTTEMKEEALSDMVLRLLADVCFLQLETGNKKAPN